jgi:hypothetical protein
MQQNCSSRNDDAAPIRIAFSTLLEETMSGMILDAGNSIIKAKIAHKEQGEITFPHAIRQLTETEYANIVSRSGMTANMQDYLRINGQPYAVGKTDERQGLVTQRSGAARYTKDYYGILAAAALGRLYERGREVSIFGSHAPGDLKFRHDLMKAVVGDWEVEINKQVCHFQVSYANTFDEPVGGLMNVLLTEDVQHYQHSDLNGGGSLVIDIGGFTTDWLAVNPGGEIDYSLARSISMGIQNVLTDFIVARIIDDNLPRRPDRVDLLQSTIAATDSAGQNNQSQLILGHVFLNLKHTKINRRGRWVFFQHFPPA